MEEHLRSKYHPVGSGSAFTAKLKEIEDLIDFAAPLHEAAKESAKLAVRHKLDDLKLYKVVLDEYDWTNDDIDAMLHRLDTLGRVEMKCSLLKFTGPPFITDFVKAELELFAQYSAKYNERNEIDSIDITNELTMLRSGLPLAFEATVLDVLAQLALTAEDHLLGICDDHLQDREGADIDDERHLSSAMNDEHHADSKSNQKQVPRGQAEQSQSVIAKTEPMQEFSASARSAPTKVLTFGSVREHDVAQEFNNDDKHCEEIGPNVSGASKPTAPSTTWADDGSVSDVSDFSFDDDEILFTPQSDQSYAKVREQAPAFSANTVAQKVAPSDIPGPTSHDVSVGSPKISPQFGPDYTGSSANRAHTVTSAAPPYAESYNHFDSGIVHPSIGRINHPAMYMPCQNLSSHAQSVVPICDPEDTSNPFGAYRDTDIPRPCKLRPSFRGLTTSVSVPRGATGNPASSYDAKARVKFSLGKINTASDPTKTTNEPHPVIDLTKPGSPTLETQCLINLMRRAENLDERGRALGIGHSRPEMNLFANSDQESVAQGNVSMERAKHHNDRIRQTFEERTAKQAVKQAEIPDVTDHDLRPGKPQSRAPLHPFAHNPSSLANIKQAPLNDDVPTNETPVTFEAGISTLKKGLASLNQIHSKKNQTPQSWEAASAIEAFHSFAAKASTAQKIEPSNTSKPSVDVESKSSAQVPSKIQSVEGYPKPLNDKVTNVRGGSGGLPPEPIFAKSARLATSSTDHSKSSMGRVQPSWTMRPIVGITKIAAGVRKKPDFKIEIAPPTKADFFGTISEAKTSEVKTGQLCHLQSLLFKINTLERSNRPSDEVLFEMKTELACLLSKAGIEKKKSALEEQKPVVKTKPAIKVKSIPRFDQSTGMRVSETSGKEAGKSQAGKKVDRASHLQATVSSEEEETMAEYLARKPRSRASRAREPEVIVDDRAKAIPSKPYDPKR